MRGFDVVILLDANLALSAGTASITEGTYLSAIGTTTFNVTDLGGGSYHVIGSIVGAIVGGWLFTLFGGGGVNGVNVGSIIVAFVGAVVFLFIWKALTGRRAM